jgi:hypothetical protein
MWFLKAFCTFFIPLLFHIGNVILYSEYVGMTMKNAEEAGATPPHSGGRGKFDIPPPQHRSDEFLDTHALFRKQTRIVTQLT